MKILFLILAFITTVNLTSYSQSILGNRIENQIQDTTYSYAYIRIQWKTFSKKLKVDVDLGDTPEQLKAGEAYSEALTNKQSFAAVLNYMAEKGFELIQTLELTSLYQVSGGVPSMVFIMKKKMKYSTINGTKAVTIKEINGICPSCSFELIAKEIIECIKK